MRSGRYVTESEAVADAFAELRAREASRPDRLSALQREIMVGIEQLDRGEAVDWNVELIKGKGRELLAARRPAS